MKVCKYCAREFESRYSCASHIKWCEKNPNNKREETIKKLKVAGKKRYGKKEYILSCVKCGKQFTVETTPYQFKKNNYRKYCSYVCSNSHIQTREQNESRGKKMKEQMNAKYGYKNEIETRVCKWCGTKFDVKKRSKRLHCSKSCIFHTAEKTFEKNGYSHSEIVLKSIKEGIYIPNGVAYVEWISYNEEINVQGTYELRTCYILDSMKERGDIKSWCYTNDKFQYKDNNGNEHFYFVDFKIVINDVECYIEVKGRIVEQDYLKWKSVWDNGYELFVWKLEDIKMFEKMYGILVC